MGVTATTRPVGDPVPPFCEVCRGHEADGRVKAALAGAVAVLQGMAGGSAPGGGTA